MLLLADRFGIFIDFLSSFAIVLNCFSKATWELQTAVLKPHGATGHFSRATCDTNLPEALEKPFAALVQLYKRCCTQ
jgi:hypothetical protein